MNEFDVEEYTRKCMKCGETYLQRREVDDEGMEHDDKCPYCGNVNWSSSAYKFTNWKING